MLYNIPLRFKGKQRVILCEETNQKIWNKLIQCRMDFWMGLMLDLIGIPQDPEVFDQLVQYTFENLPSLFCSLLKTKENYHPQLKDQWKSEINQLIFLEQRIFEVP